MNEVQQKIEKLHSNLIQVKYDLTNLYQALYPRASRQEAEAAAQGMVYGAKSFLNDHGTNLL